MAYTEATKRWAAGFNRCWACGNPGEWKGGLEIHHFVRGCNRHANALETTAIACFECHNLEEHNGKSLGLLRWMALKSLYDAEHANREKVNALRGEAKDAISEHELLIEISSIFRFIAATEG